MPHPTPDNRPLPMQPLPQDLNRDPMHKLINDLARPIYAWRMWSSFLRPGRDKVLQNVRAEIDTIVTEYVRAKEQREADNGA